MHVETADGVFAVSLGGAEMPAFELTFSEVQTFERDIEFSLVDRQPNLSQPQLELLVAPDEPFGRELVCARFGALAIEVRDPSIA
jgi:hypothetical protein